MHDELTEREREVIIWLARGYTRQQTADQLSISHRTVHTHASNVYRKIHAHNIVHAVAILVRDGIVNVEEITADVHKLCA